MSPEAVDPWIAVRVCLADTAKVARIRRAVPAIAKVDAVVGAQAAVGALVGVWGRVDSEIDLLRTDLWEGADLDLVDSIAHHQGFGQAMVGVGWLKVVETGLRFVGLRRYHPQSYKKRQDNQRRQQAKRDRMRDGDRDAGRDEPRDQNRDVTEQQIQLQTTDTNTTTTTATRDTAAGVHTCFEENETPANRSAQEELAKAGFDSDVAADLAVKVVAHGRPEGTLQYIRDMILSSERLNTLGRLTNPRGWLRTMIEAGGEPTASVVSDRQARSRHDAQMDSSAKQEAEWIEREATRLQGRLGELPANDKSWILDRVREIVKPIRVYDARAKRISLLTLINSLSPEQRLRDPYLQDACAKALAEHAKAKLSSVDEMFPDHAKPNDSKTPEGSQPPPDQAELELEHKGESNEP
jgi:hypothetical protein